MAIVSTIIAMTPFYSPFERPPDDVALWSPIPRGLRGFTVHNGTIDAKPVNDSIELLTTWTLPTQYAYVIADYGFFITGAAPKNWRASVGYHLANFFQGQDILGSQEWQIEFQNSPALTTVARSTIAQPKESLFSGPMWSAPGLTGITGFLVGSNENASVAGTGTVNAFVSFWEFDREQIRKFTINTPAIVRSR